MGTTERFECTCHCTNTSILIYLLPHWVTQKEDFTSLYGQCSRERKVWIVPEELWALEKFGVLYFMTYSFLCRILQSVSCTDIGYVI